MFLICVHPYIWTDAFIDMNLCAHEQNYSPQYITTNEPNLNYFIIKIYGVYQDVLI